MKQNIDFEKEYKKLKSEYERLLIQNRSLFAENFDLKKRLESIGTSYSAWSTFKKCLIEGLNMSQSCLNTFLSRSEFAHIKIKKSGIFRYFPELRKTI